MRCLFIIIASCLVIIRNVESAAVTLNPHPKLVVFSFDGFRYDYLDKPFGPTMTKAEAPTLRNLRAQGVTTPYMIPQFTTKTFPNHQSISTGRFTENHGIVDNAVYDIQLGRDVSGYKDERDFWVFSDAVLPIWLLNEMAGEGRVSGAQFPGSTQAYGKNQMNITYPLKYDGSMPFKDRMDYAVNWLTRKNDPANLVFMYFEEPDKQGHSHGPNSVQVKNAIENLDKLTSYFLDELKKYNILDQVNIIILSDHGMEEVKEKNKVSLSSLLDPKYEYTWRGGSPLLQIWPKVEAETDAIYNALVAASKSKPFNVYRKNNLPPHWHYYNQRRISPILIATDAGFAFDEKWEEKHQRDPAKEPIDPESTRGYHGYDTNSPNMRAFFMATGPAFEEKLHVDPFNNVDLFPLMCKIIDIPTPRHDGNLDRVVGALRTKKESSAHGIQTSVFLIPIMTLASRVATLM